MSSVSREISRLSLSHIGHNNIYFLYYGCYISVGCFGQLVGGTCAFIVVSQNLDNFVFFFISLQQVIVVTPKKYAFPWYNRPESSRGQIYSDLVHFGEHSLFSAQILCCAIEQCHLEGQFFFRFAQTQLQLLFAE